MSIVAQDRQLTISIGRMHAGQVTAYRALRAHRFKALRCGRRWGKTDFAKIWIADGLVRGLECAWFAPQNNTWSEVFSAMVDLFRPIVTQASKNTGVIRLSNSGRLDFWTLGSAIAGRGRRYQRVVIDEAAFTKNGDNTLGDSMMGIWEKAIKPTLYDYVGEVLACSNSAGKNPDNFFYNICTVPEYGFVPYHATTFDNPLLPKRVSGETREAWLHRRAELREELIRDNDPLVYAQEHLAEFVDWSGVSFFDREKLLHQGKPLPLPTSCDGVFAIIDTASKTGTEHDSTAVTFFARDMYGRGVPLLILDWDVVQIEGSLLEAWLPTIFARLEELARACCARAGAMGAWIEDKNSGTILLQQAIRRGLRAEAIASKLTALGKDSRALNISGYVHQGQVKFTEHAFNKTTIHKQKSKNHLLDQVESFRMGNKEQGREDDLLDTFCYGVALGLGNSDGF